MGRPLPEIHGILRDTVNKRAVRIPLECILALFVYITLYSSNLFSGGNDITDETKSDSGEALKRTSSQQTLCQVLISLKTPSNTSQTLNDNMGTLEVLEIETLDSKKGGSSSTDFTKKKKAYKWLCTVCGAKCTSENKLLQHLKSHNTAKQKSKRSKPVKGGVSKKTLKCDKCSESFETKEILMLHLCEHTDTMESTENQNGKCDPISVQSNNDALCNELFTMENVTLGNFKEDVRSVEEENEDEQGMENKMDEDDDEKEKMLSCEECGKSFASTIGLKNHLRKHRKTEKSHQCAKCDKSFGAFSSLRRHTRTAHEQFFKCAMCYKFFKGKKTLKEHMMSKHEYAPKIHKCHNCDQNFDSEDSLAEHKNNCKIKCDLCDKELKGKNSYKKHMIRVHGEVGTCACIVCGQQFPSVSSLKRHESTHTEGQPYQCAICGKTYKTDLILKFHMDEHTGQTFQCTICNKTYKTRQNLKSHMYTHKAKTKTFQCDICGKSLTRSKTLKIHLQIHSDERKFQCKFCDRAFNTLSYLDRHIKCVHENIKRFECNICGKTFSYKHNQQDHMTIHTGERNVECPKCGLKFSTKRSLASHMVNHIETENFHCDMCGKAFKTKTYLKNHKANHLNERRFKCVVCGEGFNTSSALVHHRKSHEKGI